VTRVSAPLGIDTLNDKLMAAQIWTLRCIRPSFGRLKSLGIYGGVLILIVVSAATRPSLLRPEQLLSIVKLASMLGIAAVGQTFVMISRGFDISQGGLIALSVVIANVVMNGDPNNILAGVSVCLLIALIVGLVNGIIVTWLRVPPVVATLGSLAVTAGGAVIYSGGVPRGSIPNAFLFVGRGYIGPLPVSALIWFLFTAVAALLLHKTVIGRSMFARGANEAAAHQSGIAVHAYGVLPYVLSSFAAGLSGLVLASYIGLADLVSSNAQDALAPIASVVVGGTSLAGGEGTVLGTSVGAFFLTFLSALIISFNMPEGVRMIATGLIIVGAIYASRDQSA
jgi:ribose transport system permease protein